MPQKRQSSGGTSGDPSDASKANKKRKTKPVYPRNFDPRTDEPFRGEVKLLYTEKKPPKGRGNASISEWKNEKGEIKHVPTSAPTLPMIAGLLNLPDTLILARIMESPSVTAVFAELESAKDAQYHVPDAHKSLSPDTDLKIDGVFDELQHLNDNAWKIFQDTNLTDFSRRDSYNAVVEHFKVDDLPRIRIHQVYARVKLSFLCFKLIKGHPLLFPDSKVNRDKGNLRPTDNDLLRSLLLFKAMTKKDRKGSKNTQYYDASTIYYYLPGAPKVNASDVVNTEEKNAAPTQLEDCLEKLNDDARDETEDPDGGDTDDPPLEVTDGTHASQAKVDGDEDSGQDDCGLDKVLSALIMLMRSIDNTIASESTKPEDQQRFKPTLIVVPPGLVHDWIKGWRRLGFLKSDFKLLVANSCNEAVGKSLERNYLYSRDQMIYDAAMETGAFGLSDPQTERKIILTSYRALSARTLLDEGKTHVPQEMVVRYKKTLKSKKYQQQQLAEEAADTDDEESSANRSARLLDIQEEIATIEKDARSKIPPAYKEAQYSPTDLMKSAQKRIENSISQEARKKQDQEDTEGEVKSAGVDAQQYLRDAESLTAKYDSLFRHKIRRMICDESQTIKNCLTYNFISAYLVGADQVIFITPTPTTNSITDLLSVLYMFSAEGNLNQLPKHCKSEQGIISWVQPQQPGHPTLLDSNMFIAVDKKGAISASAASDILPRIYDHAFAKHGIPNGSG